MRLGRIDHRVLGLITVAIGLAFTIGVLAGAIGPQMFSGGGHRLTAVFQNAQQLIPGDEVRVDGIDEGAVTHVDLNPGGRSTTVVMSVKGSAGPLYRDATATIAWKTLLGGAFNVELTRGHPSSGSLDGGTIAIANTSNQVELDDLLSVDNGGARTGLQRMFPELATALSDPQPPARTLGALADVAPSVTAGVGALRGQLPDSDLRSLVTGIAATVRALNAPDDGLRAVVQGAAATVEATAARSADIQAALDAATPAMDQTRATFGQLTQTLKLADPLLHSLMGPAQQVAPTLAALHPTVAGARTLLDHAVPLLRALPPALSSLSSTARAGLPLLNNIQPSVDDLEGTVLPYLNTIDPGTGHTTAEMIGPTTEALGPDIAGQEDQNGHFIRFPATAGSSPLYLPCQTYFGNPAYHNQLLECSSLQSMLSAALNFNPFSAITNSNSGGATRGAAPASHGVSATPPAADAVAGSTPSASAAPAAAGAAAAPSSAPATGAVSGAIHFVLNTVADLGAQLTGGARP